MLNLVELFGVSNFNHRSRVFYDTGGIKEEKNLKAKQKKMLASQMAKQYSLFTIGKSHAAFFYIRS
jgi:hypothetical protein